MDGIEVVDIAHAIQLALAPVFLLSGIRVFLGVLASRLARIVHRARNMEKELRLPEARDADRIRGQLQALSQRARYINIAITLRTVAALLGLEHFSRKTIPDLDDLIVVTDESRRGLTTGERIRDNAREIDLKYQNLYVIVNKVTGGSKDRVLENSKGIGLLVIGTIPYDESLAKIDLVGDPLMGLPDESPAVQEMTQVVGKLGL